ncbi:MAG: c-type cytochrome [Flavobacteriales bacterium]|nr:c-type cytochrome [Flavobacteriales bacterium]MCB9166827.1 c-type cytochrome [Flavobacteriales bacterium]
MKKLLKIVLYLVLIALVVIVGAITYVSKALPNIEAPKDLKVEVTPERVARGEYLANHVCVCMDCHSTRDWNTFAAPLKPGTLGKGGEVFDRSMNFPGRFISRNITPHGIGDWSDGEIYRAITSGVSRDGHPFFPVMPYPNYRTMDSEDVYSLIAYLRSLAPIDSSPDPSEADFPMSVILHTIPKPAEPVKRPDPADPVAYGAYLVNAAGCGECHTKAEKGKKIGEPFAGGFEFHLPNGAVLRSANITPEKTTGIGAWTREAFIARFKQYSDSTYMPAAIDWKAGDFQTIMPWMMYTGMTDQDLGAIYEYLSTVKPVASTIVRWTPPGS